MALDVVQQRKMDVKEGAGVDGEVPDTQLGHRLHHQIEYIVPVAQVVVERYGHPVLQPGEGHRLPDGAHYFPFHHASSLPRPISRAMAMVCRARSTMGASIILPRRATAPLPCSLARRMVSITS